MMVGFVVYETMNKRKLARQLVCNRNIGSRHVPMRPGIHQVFDVQSTTDTIPPL